MSSEQQFEERPWSLGPWAHVTRGYFDSGDEIWSLGNEDDPIQFPVADYAAMGEPEAWDRRLIELAPEMAEAILQWHGCFDEHCCDEHHSKCRCHVRLGNVANQLEAIGGDHGTA